MTHEPGIINDDLSISESRVSLTSGLQLAIATQGSPSGVPVVFLHGGSDSWRSFSPLLPHLPPSVYAVALSQRGHGDSARPASGYRPTDFADDVAVVLDVVGVNKAVIVGHSMGTSVAQRFAVDYPERVLGLVLLAAVRTWERIPDIAELQAAVQSLTDPVDPGFVREFQLSTIVQPVDPSFVDLVVRESLKLPARVWQAVFDDFPADTTYERIADIAVPTLLIWGDRDTVTTRSEQDILLATIPDARLIVYEGTGHAVHWEQPARVADDLVDFIGSLRP